MSGPLHHLPAPASGASPSRLPRRNSGTAAPVNEALSDLVNSFGDSRTAMRLRELSGRLYRHVEVCALLKKQDLPATTRKLHVEELEQIRMRSTALRHALLRERPGAAGSLDSYARAIKLLAQHKVSGATPGGQFEGLLMTSLQRSAGMLLGTARAYPRASRMGPTLPSRGGTHHRSIEETLRSMDNATLRRKVQAVIDFYHGQTSGAHERRRGHLKPDDVIMPCRRTQFPLDALLALGAIESNLGAAGRGARTFNMCNVRGNGRASREGGFMAGNFATIRALQFNGYWARFENAEDLMARGFRRYNGARYCEGSSRAYVRKFKAALADVRRILTETE